MKYSCFDPNVGLYDYFEDALQIPINADLPVPQLPAAGKVGVAAIRAARPMPPGAQHVGQGWHAKGMVVNCRPMALGAAPSFDGAWGWVKDGGWKWIAAGAATLFVLRRI